MKFIITSDIHFKLSTFSPLINDYEGIYYPTQNLLLCQEYAKKYKADAIIIAGDFLDRPPNSNLLVDKIMDVIDSINIPTYILLGNHDVTIKHNEDIKYVYTSMRPFKSDNVHIIKESESSIFNNIVFIPYHEREKIITEVESFAGYTLITHIDINGFEMRTGLSILTKEFNKENLQYYNKVITGHYHKPQENDNVIYTGSPWHVRADELIDDKYIWLYDNGEMKKLKSIKQIYKEILVEDKKYVQDVKKEIKQNLEKEPHLKIRIKIKDKILFDLFSELQNKYTGHILLQYIPETKKEKNNETKIDKTMDNKIITVAELLDGYLTKEEFNILSENDLIYKIFDGVS